MGVDPLTGAVFLDRDGVLNRAFVRDGVSRPPSSIAELVILPGVPEALERLAGLGLLLIGVTNQPDVARGTQTADGLAAINRALQERLPLLEIRSCTHDGTDGCACRKPRPGLLRDAAAAHGIALRSSFMVGDRWSDVEAGRAAGCVTLLIDPAGDQRSRCQPDDVVADLQEAALRIEQRIKDLTEERVTDTTPSLAGLKVRIFADGADKDGMLEMARLPYVAGFTTNPTLMRKAGVEDYRAFARLVLAEIPDRPISFEVFSDEFGEMERQAREIATWGPHVYVKVPVTNTRRESTGPLIRRLSADGIRLNVTAILTLDQVREVSDALGGSTPACVSVFAGRVADTGRDPVPHMTEALSILRRFANQELIWASPRELLNVFQADAIGCHIITVTNDVLRKLSFVGKDLDDYSLETVRMFHDDAAKAGYRL